MIVYTTDLCEAVPLDMVRKYNGMSLFDIEINDFNDKVDFVASVLECLVKNTGCQVVEKNDSIQTSCSLQTGLYSIALISRK